MPARTRPSRCLEGWRGSRQCFGVSCGLSLPDLTGTRRQTLHQARSELEAGLPDGMKCDQRGNVWVTAPGGVWVYSPAGELLGKVRVPEMVANLAWGGPDFRTLYLTATHSVYAIPTKVGPRNEPYMSGRRSTGPAVSPSPAPASPVLATGDMQIDRSAAR